MYYLLALPVNNASDLLVNQPIKNLPVSISTIEIILMSIIKSYIIV